MRTLLTLLIITVLIVIVGPATAETKRQVQDPLPTWQTRDPSGPGHAPVILQLSPMFLEIHRINEAAVAREQELLTGLAAAQEEEIALQFVARLERLETERQLDVLKVRVKHARLDGRFDLAYRLRQEILTLLRQDVEPLM